MRLQPWWNCPKNMITDYKKFEKKYTNDPDDPVVLEEYCDFLKEYLSQGFMEKQMEQIYRNQYTQLLLKQLDQKVNLHTCVCLMENLMVQRDFFLAEKILKIMDQNWHRGEEYWIWKIRYLAERKNGERTETELTGIEGRAYLSFFQRKGGTGILAGWIKEVKAFQFKGILVILGCFLLIGAILFAERSGLSYQEKAKKLTYLDADKVVTEETAVKTLKPTCLVLT